MFSELMNLVPRDAKDAFRRDYFTRLGTLAGFVLALAVVIHGVLLSPAYIFLETQIAGRQTELARISASLNTAEEKQVDARLSMLEQDTAYLAQLGSSPKASVALAGILGISRPGIRLTGFTYGKPDASGNGQMTVTGISDTRETLRAFVLALQAAPFIATADLPVSAYAQDKNIQFSIAITGTLQP
ncbi:MAG: hypothetical protein KGI41_02055 [Patescibacteria group bacterium]|nr:hypothetical protein [Patescibacteria group bacterium]MDE1966001.1 hypothetical protein [Patescibacteria group bacterium]